MGTNSSSITFCQERQLVHGTSLLVKTVIGDQPSAQSTLVSLHFDRFVHECQTATVDKADTMFIVELTNKMSSIFDSEGGHMTTLLSDYFQFEIETFADTDGLIVFQPPLLVRISKLLLLFVDFLGYGTGVENTLGSPEYSLLPAGLWSWFSL